MKKQKRSSVRFAKGMLIYGLILLVIVLAALSVLFLFLRSYEKSQPKAAINSYIEHLDADRVAGFSGEFIESLSTVRDNSFVVDQLLADLKASVPVRGKAESPEQFVYYLKNNDLVIEKVTLAPGGSCGFGYTSWDIADEELVTKNLSSELSITVPPEYSVYCDGRKLDSQFITDNKVEYDLLKGFYEDYECPYLVTYFTGSMYGDASIEIKDGGGNPVPFETLTEDRFTDNCTAEEKEQITQFANDYVAAYIQLTSNTVGDYYSNYYRMTQHVVDGSDLHNRFRELMKSIAFNMSNGDELRSVTVNRIMKLNDRNYVLDVSYTYDTTGQLKVRTTNTNNEKLMLRLSSLGIYQAEYLVTY